MAISWTRCLPGELKTTPKTAAADRENALSRVLLAGRHTI
jgi:hypothetical protein